MFLSFLQGDTRIKDALRWSFSIDNKIFAINLFYEEVLEQIPKCFDALKTSEEEGIGSLDEAFKLAVKYEAFLNSIYALCENLSRIICCLYRSKTLPQNFSEQRSRFLKDSSIDSDYSTILKATDWYDEVSAIRSEATHYLSGLIVFPSPAKLGYANIPKSKRRGTPDKILINNIENHLKQIYGELLTFLSLFGRHFLKILNPDSRLSYMCLSSSSKKMIGSRSISLKELLASEKWTCQGSATCPARRTCDAKKS